MCTSGWRSVTMVRHWVLVSTGNKEHTTMSCPGGSWVIWIHTKYFKALLWPPPLHPDFPSRMSFRNSFHAARLHVRWRKVCVCVCMCVYQCLAFVSMHPEDAQSQTPNLTDFSPGSTEFDQLFWQSVATEKICVNGCPYEVFSNKQESPLVGGTQDPPNWGHASAILNTITYMLLSVFHLDTY